MPRPQKNRSHNVRVFFIRHGEPAMPGGKVYLGQADLPLSERGKNEAEEARKKLAALNAQPKRIYSSVFDVPEWLWTKESYK